MSYDEIPTEAQKKAKRKKLHSNRPNPGAVNDHRKYKPPKEDPDDTNEEFQASLAQPMDHNDEEEVTVIQLASKYGIDSKKLRSIIRKETGQRAPKVTEAQPNNFGPKARYSWPKGHEALQAVEEAILKHQKKGG